MENRNRSISDMVGEALGLDPNVAYRPMMIPAVKMNDGSIKPGVPSAFVELMKAFMLPGHVAQGGSYTPEDVTDMAMNVGMMAAPVGYANTPKGAIGMFAGKNAKNANLFSLREAQKLTSQGIDRADIWKNTGWFQDVDGHWKFEIDDSVSSISDNIPSMGKLGDIVDHVKLFENYPVMKNVDFVTGNPYGSSIHGMWSGNPSDPSDTAMMMLNRGTPNTHSTALHEMQHGVQKIENFSPVVQTGMSGLQKGTPAWTIYENILNDIRTPSDIQTFAKNAGFDNTEQAFPHYREYLDNIPKKIPREIDVAAQQTAVQQAYNRSLGEVEARNVQKRRAFTPDQRRNIPPWETIDVPLEQIIFKK